MLFVFILSLKLCIGNSFYVTENISMAQSAALVDTHL